MEESTHAPCYEFGGYRLDAQRRRLVSIAGSQPVALPPRVLETLLYLVEHPGELVDKTALLSAVWPDEFAEENSLSQNISILRRILGETPSEHRFIVTVPGRGYRFVAPVSRVKTSSLPHTTPDAAGSDMGGLEASSDAHILWSQAEGLANKPSEDNLRGALTLLARATEIDPRMARAWRSVARICGTCVVYDYPVDDALARAERASRQAIELDPGDPAAFAALGVAHAMRGKWIDAESEFLHAADLRLDPLVKNLHGIHVSQAVGHLERALEDALDAYRLTAAHGFDANMVALVQVLRGQDDEVLRWADIAVSFGMPIAMAPQPDLRAQLAYRAGRQAEAAALWKASCSAAFRTAGGLEAIDLVCAAFRDGSLCSRASASLRAIEERLPARLMDQGLRKRFIVWHTMLGDLDAAHGMMDRSLTHFAQSGFVGSAWGALWMPELRPFRQDSRFQMVAQRLGLFPYWDKYGPPDGHQLRHGRITEDRER